MVKIFGAVLIVAVSTFFGFHTLKDTVRGQDNLDY